MNRHALGWAARVVLIVAAALVPPGTCPAQGTREDYARADGLRERTRGKVVPLGVDPHWFAGGVRFWYRNDRGDGAREFVIVDAVAGSRRPAFDPAKLAAALDRATESPHEAARPPFERIEVTDEGAIRFEAHGRGWRYDPEADRLEPGEPLEASTRNEPPRGRRAGRRPGRSPRGVNSPDGRWAAIVKDHNVHLVDLESHQDQMLSTGGTDVDGYEDGVFWSPDSTRFIALRTKKGDDRKVYLIESSPRDQVQPRLQSYDYLKPGDRLSIARPHLFDVASLEEVPVADDLFANPWSLGQFGWSADSTRFTFLYNQRGHQVLRLVALDAASGAATAIIEERSSTFIDYSQKLFRHDC